ncbi:hypothetical protein JJL45_05355 [Tamlana sp. s12]|uniref:LuxR C-terminal-related transcriptional regulator n=1 Tax=Tamlana sp. s12 TaxID=1630406 RepID=UPI0007FFA194|nr:hypothetical protein [Tamlana sp. s12]OBQ56068.1 hypothetical protein VQ01_06705 [Tamlana sp. s12]QQY83419.1 hypothetical protein JJL45_05355 [Tamlana sp. s12]
MTKENRIYPGLTCANLEFFNHEGKVKAFTKGKMVDFEDLPYTYHQLLREAINDEPETDAILKEWEPNSELKQLHKFVECRFGGLDYTPDIQNMELQDGEYWDCPLRGNCKGEGKVCRQLSYNNQNLSNNDIKFLKLVHTPLTNEALAEEFNMAMGTFHQFKKRLYQKLNIQTKPEAVLVAVMLNLL